MKSTAGTAADYLKSLPPDRRAAIARVRKVILDNLPPGYEERMLMGMIAYVIPLDRFPDTYNGQPLMMAALASQKNHMSLYLMCVYGDSESAGWFKEELSKTGKKLDMGKACVRFRKIDDLPLELVARTIARVSVADYVAVYEKARGKQGGAVSRQSSAKG
jgi:hypothetical protein